MHLKNYSNKPNLEHKFVEESAAGEKETFEMVISIPPQLFD